MTFGDRAGERRVRGGRLAALLDERVERERPAGVHVDRRWSASSTIFLISAAAPAVAARDFTTTARWPSNSPISPTASCASPASTPPSRTSNAIDLAGVEADLARGRRPVAGAGLGTGNVIASAPAQPASDDEPESTRAPSSLG